MLPAMKDRKPLTCKACRYTWTPRKATHSPRYRCPACFRLVHPTIARKYQDAAALATKPA